VWARDLLQWERAKGTFLTSLMRQPLSVSHSTWCCSLNPSHGHRGTGQKCEHAAVYTLFSGLSSGQQQRLKNFPLSHALRVALSKVLRRRGFEVLNSCPPKARRRSAILASMCWKWFRSVHSSRSSCLGFEIPATDASGEPFSLATR